MLSLIRIHAFIYQQGMSNDYKSEEPSNQRDTVRPKNTTEGSCLGIDSHIFFIPLPLDSSVNGSDHFHDVAFLRDSFFGPPLMMT